MSSCDCSYDTPVVFESKFVKARKEYVCFECKAAINKGDIYCNDTGLWPGDGWETYRFCEPCGDLRASIEEVVCSAYGTLKECYIEYLRGAEREIPNNHLTKNHEKD